MVVVAGETFGLKLSGIAEIIRLPNLAHVPLVPPSLLGLANLRGTVLPVLSTANLLGRPLVEAGEQTRVVVTRGDTPVGFVVDRVDRLLAVATDQVEHNDAAGGTIDPALIEGVIRGGEGGPAIKLLNTSQLLVGQFTRLGIAAPRGAARALVATVPTAIAPVDAQLPLLSFDLDRQEYALPLQNVREVVPLPHHVAEVPRAETAVLGVVTLRDRLLPVVSLRALLGLPVAGGDRHRHKIVVLSLGDTAVGMVVDATREILRVDPDRIDPAPALLTRGAGDAEISAICRLDQGRRLVALLLPDRLFRSELVRRISSEQDVAAGSETRSEAETMADEQFVVFRLGDQDYGIHVAAVREIARLPDHVTRLPKAPAFVDGVINLRGSVLPIIDLRRRFELGAVEQAGSRRVLILEFGEAVAGFLVDGVSGIRKVPSDAVCASPELSADQMRLISRVVNLEAEGRMILIVEPAQLLDQVESDLLTKFAPAAADTPTTVP